MTDAELPKAIATGGAGQAAAGDGVLAPVQPRRVAIAVGGTVALYLLVALVTFTVPTTALHWLGGPSDDLSRYGGLRLVWRPPAGADQRALDAQFQRDGDAYVVAVPHVAPDDITLTAERIAGSGRLEFHVVRQVREMAELARVLDLPMKDAWPVDLEVDQWMPEEGGGRQTDYFLRGPRADLEAAVAEAKRRGWKLPAGTTLAYEYVDNRSYGPSSKHPQYWRTYVIDEAVALDRSSIERAIGSYDPNMNRPIVLIEFTREGGEKFGDLTAGMVGHKLATLLDGEVKSAPIINGAIRGGRASVTMGGSDPQKQERERDALIATLSGGELPSGGQVVEARYVSPATFAFQLWLARIALALIGGAIAGALAWLAVRALRPLRRRTPALAGDARIATRLGWTAGAIALWIVGIAIMLPGLNGEEAESVFGHARHAEAGLFDLQQFSIFALGLVPAVTAHVIVEVVVSIVPRWRKPRDGGFEARRKIGLAVAILTIVIAAVQAYFVASYLEALDRGAAFLLDRPGMAWRWETVATLTAGAVAQAWLASVITRRGIGNGYAVLIAAGWLLGVPSSLRGLGDASAALAIATMLAIAGIYLVTSRWRVRGAGRVAMPVPSAGFTPLSEAGGVMVLISTLAVLGVFGDGPARAANWLAPLQYEKIAVLVLIGSALLWSFVFARPGRRARELDRAELGAPTREMWLRAVVITVFVLVAVRALVRVTAHVDPLLARITDPVLVLFVAATLADVWEEARDRRRGLVAVWPLHDPLLADAVRDRLAAVGIDHHLQASRLRTLLWLWGAHVPMHVLVPADRAEDAVRIVAGLFE